MRIKGFWDFTYFFLSNTPIGTCLKMNFLCNVERNKLQRQKVLILEI